MKKATLGLVLAMMLAVLPVSLFATSAVAAGSTTLHVMNGNVTNGTIDVYLDGVKVADDLPAGGGVDITVDAGSPVLNACTGTSVGVNGAGVCQSAALPTPPASNVGALNQGLSIDANANYSLVIQDGGPTPAFIAENNLTLTGLGEFRYTAHSTFFIPTAKDICIGGVKVITNLLPNSSQEADVTAQQGAAYAIFDHIAGPSCASPNATVSFVAGTNFVQTLAATSNPTCGAGCVAVLLVGEGTVPNNPDTAAFCATILNGPDSLSGFGPALKTLIGNVDPTSKTTIQNTQPSVGAQKAFVSTYTGVLNAGDASVPAAINDSWVTLTSGIRKLLQTFQLASYDLSNLPPVVVEALVEGANGVKLPGVPPDADVVAATADLTAFVTGTCLASAGGGGGGATTPATPVNAAARFTG